MSDYQSLDNVQGIKPQLSRIFEATGCRTQVELANLLGIRQSSVSEALKRERIPSRWLVKLQGLGVNIDWITTGSGPAFASESGAAYGNGLSVAQFQPAESTILRDILRCFPAKELIAELRRRNIAPGDTSAKP